MSHKTATIKNPILRGFNPDPSIVRVGDDYYIATSTFEWYPGVQIHHSRDLAHWRLLTRPLNRPTQLNMLGDPDSCGIWAPCLTFSDGLFYLIYTDVKRNGRTTHGCQRLFASRHAQLPRHQQYNRRRMVRSDLPQQQRF
jgi:xylan 1,4-beta-xylosidase